MGRTLLHGTRGAAAAARHLLWYLAYCVDGSATRPSAGLEAESHFWRAS